MICRAMQDLVATGKVEVSEELRELLEPTPGETLKEQQQELNKRRKLIQKLERLKKAKLSKAAAWKNYQEEMARMLRQEQDRHEEDQLELQQAIDATQTEIDKMGQEEDEEMPKPEPENASAMTEANQELRQKLAEEQMKTTQIQNALLELQHQFRSYVAQHTSDSPNPDAPSPQQVKTPRVPTADDTKKDKSKETRDRQERMKKVEDEMRRQKERERSPRRESQESQNFDSLG